MLDEPAGQDRSPSFEAVQGTSAGSPLAMTSRCTSSTSPTSKPARRGAGQRRAGALLRGGQGERLGRGQGPPRHRHRARGRAQPRAVPVPHLPSCRAARRQARHGTKHEVLIWQVLDQRGREQASVTGRGTGAPARIAQPERDPRAALPATNLPVPEIAGQLTLSANTIRTHIRHLYEKLGAHSRAKAVDRARALGLLAPHRVLARSGPPTVRRR
jgi:LuxR family transcriptional regulator, maltose regulon positive regulatory protein